MSFIPLMVWYVVLYIRPSSRDALVSILDMSISEVGSTRTDVKPCSRGFPESKALLTLSVISCVLSSNESMNRGMYIVPLLFT